MPKFKNYTAKLVERQILAVIRRNPDSINPSDGVACLYHEGRGGSIKRCLIGQWGYEQGFRTPKPDNGTANEVIDEIWSRQADFTEDAVVVMCEFQSRADGDKKFKGKLVSSPVPWKELLPLS